MRAFNVLICGRYTGLQGDHIKVYHNESVLVTDFVRPQYVDTLDVHAQHLSLSDYHFKQSVMFVPALAGS